MSFRQKAGLVLAGIIAFFVLLEVSLRLGGLIILSVQECRNTLSLRHKSAYRILCIGESTTADQYPFFLQKALDRSCREIKFSVIDKGLRGINTSGILSRLEPNLDKYRPDMVVVMMGINDFDGLAPYAASIDKPAVSFFRELRVYKLLRLIRMRILDKTGRGKGSIADEKYLREAIKTNPKDYNAYFTLKWLFRDQGGISSSENVLIKAIQKDPQEAWKYFDLGWFYLEHDKFSQAEDIFKKVIALDPKNEWGYIELGCLYRDNGRLPEAEGVFKKAIEIDKENYNMYLCLGGVYLEQGKFSQAEDIFRKAIAMEPEKPWVYFEMGGLYRRQGKFIQAQDAFRKAAILSPQDTRICAGIRGLSEEAGIPALAEEYLRKPGRQDAGYYPQVTVSNYLKLKDILDRRGIRLVCVQYPMRSILPLKEIFAGNDKGMVFVDNEASFREAVRREGYKEYFVDMFGGDFGHCQEKGNILLAENIARGVLKEITGK